MLDKLIQRTLITIMVVFSLVFSSCTHYLTKTELLLNNFRELGWVCMNYDTVENSYFYMDPKTEFEIKVFTTEDRENTLTVEYYFPLQDGYGFYNYLSHSSCRCVYVEDVGVCNNGNVYYLFFVKDELIKVKIIKK